MILVNGEFLTPDPMGALYWARRDTLIVSDLHFEKGSSFARRGVFLPPYDTRATLKRLAALMARYRPKRVVSLGDAFHDGEAEARMHEDDAAQLERLMTQTTWVWVLGNHDPAPPARFSAEACEALDLGRLTLRHEPRGVGAPGEIAGHLHPCARVVCEGRVLRRRCFASDGARLVMPAFGAYAGGLNILDEAFAPLFDDFTAWVLGADAVYPIGRRQLASEGEGRRRLRA